MHELEEKKQIGMIICFVLACYLTISLAKSLDDNLPKSYVEKGTYEIVETEKYINPTFLRGGGKTYWIIYYVDGHSVKKLEFNYSDMPEIEIGDTKIPLLEVEDEISGTGTKKEVYKIRASKEWIKTNYTEN